MNKPNELQMLLPPVCWGCKHVLVDVNAEWTEMGTLSPNSAPLSPACASFPDGVPAVVYVDGNDHTSPVGGEKTVDGKPILFELSSRTGWYLHNRRVLQRLVDEELARGVDSERKDKQAEE